MLFNLHPKKKKQSQYAGFMVRLFAAFIDMILFTVIIAPILEIFSMMFMPEINEEELQNQMLSIAPQEQFQNLQEFLNMFSEWFRILDEAGVLLGLEIIYATQFILFTLASITFWRLKSATPGKMFFRIRIVDAKTGEKPTMLQLIVRFLGYFISAIPLGIGFVWMSFDKKCQGWHDKLARTIIVKVEKKSKPIDEYKTE